MLLLYPRELCILLSDANMLGKQALGARGKLLCHPQQQQAGLRHCGGGSPGAGRRRHQGGGCSSRGQRQSERQGLARWRPQRWSKKKHGRGGGSGEQVTSLHTRSRPGWGQVFASAIYAMVSKPSGVMAAQRRHRRAADPHAGSQQQQAFPCGRGCIIQHPTTPVFSTCHGPQAL
jgi:hypothetical protein